MSPLPHPHPLVFSLLALVACKGDAATDDWWTVSTGYTGPDELPAADTANLDTGGGDDNARELRGSLRQANMTAEVEMRYYLAVDGEVLCDVRYGSDAFAQLNTCKPCIAAFSMTLSDRVVTAEQDGTCTQEGWSALEGTVLNLGLDATTAYWDVGAGWEAVGSATPSSSGFTVVIPL